MPRKWIAALLVVGFPALLGADLVPLTDPVVIGQQPIDYLLYQPDAAAVGSGFVVAWGASFTHYTGGSQPLDWGSAIKGRKVGADGVPVGGELPLAPVALWTEKGAPRVAGNAAGAFVVTWAGRQTAGVEVSENLRRFPAEGAADRRILLDHFRSESISSERSAVALDAAGRAFAVWRRPSPAPYLLGQLFLPSGRPLGERFWITLRSAFKESPDVAMDGRGQAVLAYENVGTHGTSTIFLRRYDAAGRPRGDEVRLVPPSTPILQENLALAVNRDGRVVVAWQDGRTIRVQRLTATLERVGLPITVASPAAFTEVHSSPDVALDDQGRFLVTWLEIDIEANNPQVRGRGYAADGTPLGAAFRVAPGTPEGVFDPAYSSRPSVAVNAAGTFLVTWKDVTSTYEDGIVARLYAVGPPA